MKQLTKTKVTKMSKIKSKTHMHMNIISIQYIFAIIFVHTGTQYVLFCKVTTKQKLTKLVFC